VFDWCLPKDDKTTHEYITKRIHIEIDTNLK
jgi:hypothetical protein